MNMKRILGFLVVLFMAIDAWPQGEGIIYTEYAPMPYAKRYDTGKDFVREGEIRLDIDLDGRDDFMVFTSNDKTRMMAYFCAIGESEPYHDQPWSISVGDDSVRFVSCVRSNVIGALLEKEDAYWQKYKIFYSDYVGMKIIVGGQAYYAWCEVAVHSYGKDSIRVDLKRSAICTIPNYPLRYGQRSTVENLESMDGVRVCNMGNGKLLLKSEGLALIKEVMICNTMGRPVAEGPFGIKSNQMTVDVGDLMEGVYMVCCVLDDGRRVTKKVLVWNR